jgi:hypothetical protein
MRGCLKGSPAIGPQKRTQIVQKRKEPAHSWPKMPNLEQRSVHPRSGSRKERFPSFPHSIEMQLRELNRQISPQQKFPATAGANQQHRSVHMRTRKLTISGISPPKQPQKQTESSLVKIRSQLPAGSVNSCSIHRPSQSSRNNFELLPVNQTNPRNIVNIVPGKTRGLQGLAIPSAESIRALCIRNWNDRMRLPQVASSLLSSEATAKARRKKKGASSCWSQATSDMKDRALRSLEQKRI